MTDDNLDPILEHADPDKREFLRKVIVGTAFVAPIVASFSMETLSPDRAFALSSNITVTTVSP
jgi:hypothetical protein